MNSISIDCLFAVNFCLDFLALRLCTTILSHHGYERRHTAAALTLAALECASCVFPRLFPAYLWALISVILVFLTYFRVDMALLYSGFSLWTGILMTFAMKFFKGVLQLEEEVRVETAAQFDKKRLILAALTLTALTFLKIYFDKTQKRPEKACLEVVYKGKKASLCALRDTGNMLKDPLSGRPVAILSKDAAKKLGVGENIVMDAASKVRVIPVKSVGHTGILYAFVPQIATVDGKKQSICIALDPKNADFSGYDAIIPSNL